MCRSCGLKVTLYLPKFIFLGKSSPTNKNSNDMIIKDGEIQNEMKNDKTLAINIPTIRITIDNSIKENPWRIL